MCFHRRRRKPARSLIIAGVVGLICYNRARARAATAASSFGGFVEIDGERLHFISRGNGFPLILLHGNGSAAEDFEYAGIMESAADRYRVIAFDRPGFGRSSRGHRPWWTPADQADLIQTALRRLGVDRCVVLGHSWGTLIALQLALRHGSHIAGLVLVSGYYFPRPRPGLFLAGLLAAPVLGPIVRMSVLPLLVRAMWSQVMRKIFGPSRVPAGFSAAMKELATRPSQLKSTALESDLLLIEACLRRPYDDIAVPTGIIAGAADQLIDAVGQAKRLHQEIGNSFVEIVDAGHMVHHARPDVVMRIIDRVAEVAEHSTALEAT